MHTPNTSRDPIAAGTSSTPAGNVELARLTLTQSAVLHFIRNFQQRQGSMPTRGEISAHFSWKSDNAAECHLKCLESKGFVVLAAGRSRNLRFTDKAWDVLGRSEPAAGSAPTLIALPVIDPSLVARAAQIRKGLAVHA